MAGRPEKDRGTYGGGGMGGRRSDQPPHSGGLGGGGQTAGLGNAGGGYNPKDRPTNGLFGGLPGFQPRRTVNPTASYQATLPNLATAFSRALPGPGLVTGAGLDIAGMRPGFSGFTGNVNGPGDYDPKNMAFGSAGYWPTTPQSYAAMLAALHPKPKPMMAAQPATRPPMQAPGLQLNSGLQGYGSFRPGYSFYGPGSAF